MIPSNKLPVGKKRENRLEKDRPLSHDVGSGGSPLVPGANLPQEGPAKAAWMHRPERLYEITLKTFNTKPAALPRRGKFILGSEHTFGSF